MLHRPIAVSCVWKACCTGLSLSAACGRHVAQVLPLSATEPTTVSSLWEACGTGLPLSALCGSMWHRPYRCQLRVEGLWHRPTTVSCGWKACDTGLPLSAVCVCVCMCVCVCVCLSLSLSPLSLSLSLSLFTMSDCIRLPLKHRLKLQYYARFVKQGSLFGASKYRPSLTHN